MRRTMTILSNTNLVYSSIDTPVPTTRHLPNRVSRICVDESVPEVRSILVKALIVHGRDDRDHFTLFVDSLGKRYRYILQTRARIPNESWAPPRRYSLFVVHDHGLQ